MDSLFQGFNTLFGQPLILLILFLGVLIGMIIGALPGLTATMGVALFLPLTFGMGALPGILLLIGLYYGSIFGGSISAILINTPGTPASAATALDGNKMTKNGKAGEALAIAAVASGIGGLISVFCLIFISPQLAGVALTFSAAEMFGLAFFGLSIIASISTGSILKGIIAGVFGLLICTIGMDPISGYPRFTYGLINLLNGFSFIPAMIGLFALSEAFMIIEEEIRSRAKIKKSEYVYKYPKGNLFRRLWGTMIRSAFIGTFIGIIPGAGADVASFISYNVGQKLHRDKKNELAFGEGNPKGVACSEAANNGVTGGAMVPLLTLGVPGDAVTAIMLGALVVQGIQPGPQIFTNSGTLIYTLFAGMLIANLLMLFLGLVGVRLFSKILYIPKRVLAPIIIVLSTIGSFAINNNFFDVWSMIGFGLLGYLMKKMQYSASPIVLALILGPMAESNMRRALVMSNGSWLIFLQRPITLVFLILGLCSLFLPILMKSLKKRSSKISAISSGNSTKKKSVFDYEEK